MPSLTFSGKTRMQIEAVRILEKYRGHKIGEWMMQASISYGKAKGASIVQLTTNKSVSKLGNSTNVSVLKQVMKA